MKKKTSAHAPPPVRPTAKRETKPKPKTIALAMVLISRDELGQPVPDSRYQILKGEMSRTDFLALRQHLADLALRAREDLEEIDRRLKLAPTP
jgi:hypothetical protein